jgi:hypothetical protein
MAPLTHNRGYDHLRAPQRPKIVTIASGTRKMACGVRIAGNVITTAIIKSTAETRDLRALFVTSFGDSGDALNDSDFIFFDLLKEYLFESFRMLS